MRHALSTLVLLALLYGVAQLAAYGWVHAGERDYCQGCVQEVKRYATFTVRCGARVDDGM